MVDLLFFFPFFYPRHRNFCGKSHFSGCWEFPGLIATNSLTGVCKLWFLDVFGLPIGSWQLHRKKHMTQPLKKHRVSGWWARATPLKNMSSSVGMISNPIYAKIKNGNQTTNQLLLDNATWLCLVLEPFQECSPRTLWKSPYGPAIFSMNQNLHLNFH